ncbi:MAG: hypothetical protein GW779_02135 [Candidatus Altiarchaeum hamiconexum]|uniref:Uncharacterized protein n=1 Tax=Candidatus Altarchaeum hamiconexum TaxID=1803513 RepID=A0A8J8CHZ4_9ARCH|nr:hypothetical protein [Candidatus Altarchaeum hamiconexum]OIQ04990.1 MAG: hypothetical protein AUK59_05610 [Candidatus Altarchaeum sp. CG2_30_32_3053]PIN67528.1 MAG: hypothetical protein COV98_02510 [Candidatus Altarchaeum sp. CG12_big_fil_rev_8_21_14_0_65_33_22]PIV28994.1 MAG: hypothetical protein COS36_00125 [Candidatus Altarchaeum sp. CG03_land_8_20_14_0_80_32_618]PIX49442.1 MAG: hypothetical protein COZ53_00620 [Candidatus Altarchaeum sp. CG_4_8_14_3_um_filter_33_2054]PIZ32078.1 MAG: hyp
MSGKWTQILGKIFGKKEKEEKQAGKQQAGKQQAEQTGQTDENLEKSDREKILYKDMDAFIKKKQEKDENATKEKAMPLIDECLRSMENMKNIVEEIKNEKITGINKRAERMVQTNKAMFVKITENVLNTDIDKDANISEIKAKILKTAQTCGETDIQYGRYVSVVHSPMENFRRNLKILANNAMDLNKMNIGQYEEYKILDDKFNTYISEKKRAAEIKNLLMDFKRELSNNQENLKELENSEKFGLMNEALNERAKVLAEKDRIEISIYTKISSVSRILKKIRRKNNIIEISLYIDNPKIFLERNDNEILNFLKLPADLNKEEREKILTYEKNFSVIVEEKKMYKEILEREERTNEDIKKYDVRDEIKRIKTDIADINLKIKQNKKDTERFEKNIQNLQIEISEIKEKLEDKLNVEIGMDV